MRNEKITPLYERLSRNDELQGESNSISKVKKIGKTTYKVRIHFSKTSTETMSDKIKRMLKNEIQQM